MTRFPVKHPEVDETLFVEEAVVRVACPRCKVAAGVPCKGARFEWIARGERRGFRYVQGTHYVRRCLFRDWKRNGSPRMIPASVFEAYTSIWGKFPKRLQRKLPGVATSRVRVQPRRKKPSSRQRSDNPSSSLPSWNRIEHRGAIWEGIEGNSLWHWHAYEHLGSYEAYYIHEFGGKFTLTAPSSADRRVRPEHVCDTLEEAMDLALDLSVSRWFLDVLNERARWRIVELERRFGEALRCVPVKHRRARQVRRGIRM
jgi:hypothetical protein